MIPAPARRIALLASTSALAVLLAACGGSAAFNDADVTFLQDMVPHHSQAVEMARLVADRTARPELREFADRVIADQTGEVDRMNALLEQAGADAAMAGMGSDDMSGMVSGQDMAELEGLADSAFDLAFLRMMTAHHEGAIAMAEAEQAEGANPEVTRLARSIAEAQRAEVEQMAAWQDAWS